MTLSQSSNYQLEDGDPVEADLSSELIWSIYLGLAVQPLPSVMLICHGSSYRIFQIDFLKELSAV